ncbi:hypothetical protein AB4151_04175 [Vibrio splendidus]|uniref:Uncharacterized protein n=1 Tax=Vibrio splendidus TaxID=29497 RepID=A0A2N7CJW5_VIBSP|nr:hypothetical protein [Vibrio splendidus]PMF33250.1 hypothetical protein BCV19_22055 [Vibrio splendidus]
MKSVYGVMPSVHHPDPQFSGATSQLNAMKLSINRVIQGSDKEQLAAKAQLTKIVNSVYAPPLKQRTSWIDKDSETIKKMYPKLKEYKEKNGLKDIPRSGHHIIGKSMLTKFLSVAVQTEQGKHAAEAYLKAVGIKEKHIRDLLIESKMLSKNIVNPEALSKLLLQIDTQTEKEKVESAVGNLLWPKWNIVMGPSNKSRSDDMCNGKVLALFKSKDCDPQLVEMSKTAERIWNAMMQNGGLYNKNLTEASLTTLKQEFECIADSSLAKKDTYWYPQEADWKNKQFSVFNAATNRMESKVLHHKNKEKGETGNPNGSTYIAENFPSRFRPYTNFENNLRDGIVRAALEIKNPKEQKKFISEYMKPLIENSHILDAREYQIMANKKQTSTS